MISISLLIILFIVSTDISSFGEQNTHLLDNSTNLNLFLLSKIFEKEIEKISNIMELTSHSPEFQVLSYNNVSEQYMNKYHGIPENEEIEKRYIFKNVMAISPSIAGLFFLLPNGDMYVEEPYHYQMNLTKTNFSFRDYYHGVIDSGNIYMGDTIISAASGIPITVVAVPIFDKNNFTNTNQVKTNNNNNRLIGILGADIDFKTFDDFLKSLPLKNNERILFLDTFGNKIADSIKSNFMNESSTLSNLSSFNNAIKGLSGNTVEEFNNTTMLISYAPVKSIQNSWALLWVKPYDENFTSQSDTTFN
jgi:hypothetical protein